MPEQWTVLDILNWTTEYFQSKELARPRRDAEEIIAHALKISRLEVYLNFEKPLNKDERASIGEMVKRRAAHEPLQYIFGKAHFRNLELSVNETVLIPRPETELLVERALELIKDVENPRVLDLCTGSGCIALSIADEHESAHIFATDISEEALQVAQKNAQDLGFSKRITFEQGDLLIPETELDLIVSNPPYVPTETLEHIDKEVRDYEPLLALDGGVSGLDTFDRILMRLHARTAQAFKCPSCILELDSSHLDEAAKKAEESGLFASVSVLKDLTDRARFLSLEARR